MTIIIKENTVIDKNTTFNEEVQIASGVTLTLNPGVKINLGGNKLLVGGTLRLNGTESQFCGLENGVVDNLDGRIQITNSSISHIDFNKYLSRGSIDVYSSVFKDSSVNADKLSVDTSLFLGSTVRIEPYNRDKFINSTLIDGYIEVKSHLAIGIDIVGFNESMRSKILNSNFIGKGNLIKLNPFFDAAGMHPIKIANCYIAGVPPEEIDSHVFDKDDDIRLTSDITPSSFNNSPYLNSKLGFVVGNEIITLDKLAYNTAINPPVMGSEGNDVLSGTNADDVIYAFQGNDTIKFSNGSDAIYGGSGLDTLSLQGPSSNYIWQATPDYTQIREKSVVFATASLYSIERISFADKSMAFDLNGVAGQAYRLYQAAFDRKPDLTGLGYWISAMDKGISLNQVAGGFLASDEFRKLYGAAPSDTDFLTALYKNVLHRSPDSKGYNWWLDQLKAGVNRADVLASFSESTENKAQVIGQIEQGIDYIAWTS